MRNLFAFILLAGCGNVNVPFGDGRLVLVDVDPDFYKHDFETASEGAWIGKGIHYWDDLGVRFRLPEEVLDDPDFNLAPHVSIERSEVELGDYAGTCWPGARTITLYVTPLEKLPSSDYTWTSTVAHELGHLMGLTHVADVDAVMSANIPAMSKINDSDKQEFRRVYR